MASPVALTIITGFLGAGKTTLINRVLRETAFRDTAVVVNEFGAVAIDHLLVERAADEVIELADGCLCCSVRGALVDTLAELSTRLGAGRFERLKRVVIETTGLADPVPLLTALAAHDGIAATFRFDGMVTVVDAVHAVDTLTRHREARRQVALADRLLLSKTDTIGVEEKQGVMERLDVLAPNIPIEIAEDVPADNLTGCGSAFADKAFFASRHSSKHDHDHASGFQSVALMHQEPLPVSVILGFLDLLRSQCGDRILRIKGIFETPEDPERPLVIHGVQGLLHPPSRLAQWPDKQRGTRLAVIGGGMDEAYVRALFSAFVGEVKPDQPDRAALVDNPLAISGLRF